MSKIESNHGEPRLDGRPLADGAELELLAAGGRWLPVVWRQGACVMQLGGDWERTQDGAPLELPLSGLDLTRVEVRRAESPARATRVVALGKWLEAQAPGVSAGDPVELDLKRAVKQFSSELPRAIEEYQEKLRHHSFDLFHSASLFAAAHGQSPSPDAVELAQPRRQLEEAALKFEETSRWLAALQMMQAEGG